MAKMPAGAKLIYNPSSAAPGFITKNVLSLPGVPSILNSMFENSKKYLVNGLRIYSKTINLYTVESNISKQLEKFKTNIKNTLILGVIHSLDSEKLVFQLYQGQALKLT